MKSPSIFLTKISSPTEKAAARLLIDSIQAFGGEMHNCPIWIFVTDEQVESYGDLASPQVEVFSLPVPEALKRYPFGSKVVACARAEAQAPAEAQSLIWLDLECLVVQPPVLYALGDAYDAALRPVHIRNVGLLPAEPLNAFWGGIYCALGIQDVHQTVETFIGHQRIRAYFNSHAFSINPRLGLLRRWHEAFERLVCDQQFQETACQEQIYQIFLFQAVLSALIASSLDEHRIRILPPTYNYPYNLQGRVAEGQRAGVLNELASLTFEGRSIHPQSVTDIEIHEPLHSWLEARITRPNE